LPRILHPNQPNYLRNLHMIEDWISVDVVMQRICKPQWIFRSRYLEF